MDWTGVLTAPVAAFTDNVEIVAPVAIGVGLTLWGAKRIWGFFKSLAH